MKNIYFIESRSPSAHIFSRTKQPRLGSILLATILKEKGYNTKVFIEDISSPDWRSLEDADMICVSSITSTAPRAYQIARRFVEIGIPVTLGGPHSTFMPEEGLKCADYVVRGEGEETIVELLDHLKRGIPLDSIRGLSFKTEEGQVIHNPARDLIPDLDSSPAPDFSLVHNWNKAKVAPIATSRGCPFACRFCSVIPMFGRKYRFKSIERVIRELKEVSSGINHVFFIDDNFAADKERTKTLLRAMKENNINIQWSAQVRVDIAKDPELVKLMADTGCFTVFVGFESINPKTLKLYNKGQQVEDNDKCIRILKAHSIKIHGMFVMGSDTDDIKTIRSTQKYAKKLDIDSLQFMMLTPFPGTPVFEELKEKGRLLHKDWNKYDAHHAVFEPKLMTPFELHYETLRSMGRFYSWPAIIRNLWQFDFFYAFVGLYGKISVRKALSGKKEYFKEIREIILAEFDRKTDMVREFLLKKGSSVRSIVLNTSSMEKNEVRFFLTFLKKAGKDLIIDNKLSHLHKNILTITPIVENIKNRTEGSKEFLAGFYEKNKERLDSIKIVNMESMSLFNACENIGLLLNINLKKIRTAYEKALKDTGGTAFECKSLIIMLKNG
jgi:radical SAM superfamily enzyme YgiQ (UPF0313 family)